MLIGALAATEDALPHALLEFSSVDF